MRATSVSMFSKAWKFATVEWSPKLATTMTTSSETHTMNAAYHFVLPDLPEIYTPQDRENYISQVPPSQRIMTVATCRYTPETILQLDKNSYDKADKLLLVGGNDKTSQSLSTCQAAQILSDNDNNNNNNNVELWGVTDPNDPISVDHVQEKIDAGVTGFITQPLLTSHALEILESYPRIRKDDNTNNVTFVAGLAMPRTARGLQFWCRLLNLNDNDPLFQAHLAYFSQPYYTSWAWIGRELQHLQTHATIDGVHFMPLGNTKDMVSIFQTLQPPPRQ